MTCPQCFVGTKAVVFSASDGYSLLMSRIMIVISVNADKYKNSYLFISVTPFRGTGAIFSKPLERILS
ncbi:MAG: hypothetical protein IKN12_12820 [Selenomonadaceae bacterium]|nr:hypothetical protein [Selenomonadaceae bacterium]